MAMRAAHNETPKVEWKTYSFRSDPHAIKAVNEKARTIEHLISTQTVDRDGECLRSLGCKADIFLRNNPIVGWNHSFHFARGAEHELPIGRALDVHVSDVEVSALTEFAGHKQEHPFASRVFLLYRDRFLNSWSVGFAREKETREKLVAGQTGNTILIWPLYEYSSVALPSNENAITQFMKSLSLPDGATEDDLGKALGTVSLKKYWEIAEQILPPADTGLAGDKSTGSAIGLSWKVMPAPKPSESEDDFMGRCMGTDVMNSEYPDQAQRAAVCHAQYDKGPKQAYGGDWAVVYPLAVSTAANSSLTVRCFTRAETDIERDVRVDPIRWNRDLSAKLFDVTRERNPAVTKEIELAAKYLDCEVKELTRRELIYHGTRMGAGLVALDEAVGRCDVEDVRNFARGTGEEAPLGYDVIRLNSQLRRSFLLDGTRFMRRTEGRLVCRISPEWRGIAITVYGKGEQLADEFCEQVQVRAASLKFYKGESFSLSGEFLNATDETWDDVFLTEKNEKAVKRVVELINAKGATMENRGVIMLGEPGTGKTLATRVMRNETRGGPVGAFGVNTKAIEPATFIWISARDFYRMGAFGGIEHAFETAKDLAPSILVFEDVDNWIGRGEIDLLKTTMDGVSRSKGIATILTTNDPAHFPTALIDRPGRFHDVLKIDLPDADQRRRMLMRWAPDITGAKYSPDQPREDNGQFGEGSGGGSGAGGSSGSGSGGESSGGSSSGGRLAPRKEGSAVTQRYGYGPGKPAGDGAVTHTHPSGATVTVERDGAWSHTAPGKPVRTGDGPISIDQHLTAVHGAPKKSILDEVVEATDGYSGAHVRELARFASILREQDGVESPDEAITLALVKVREQRDLIAQTHAAQGRYVPRAAVTEAVKMDLIAGVKKWETGQIAAISRNADGKIAAFRRYKSFTGFEARGYTAPASGATSPTHVHDYELEGDDEGAFEYGCAKHVADHSHRITAASLARGETEPSDGHVHTLMTSAEVMAALVTPGLGLSDLDVEVKDGRVLAAINYAKLKTAHAMIAEVIAAHDATLAARQPAAPDEPTEVGKALDHAEFAHALAVAVYTEPARPRAFWIDHDVLARDLRARLAVHTSPGAAGR